MDSISKTITSRSGFSKAILVIREKIVCLKEGRTLFSDDGPHCLREERSDCNGIVVEWIRFVAIFRIGKMWACFHEVGNVPRVRES